MFSESWNIFKKFKKCSNRFRVLSAFPLKCVWKNLFIFLSQKISISENLPRLPKTFSKMFLERGKSLANILSDFAQMFPLAVYCDFKKCFPASWKHFLQRRKYFSCSKNTLYAIILKCSPYISTSFSATFESFGNEFFDNFWKNLQRTCYFINTFAHQAIKNVIFASFLFWTKKLEIRFWNCNAKHIWQITYFSNFSPSLCLPAEFSVRWGKQIIENN
jgi:hypothetical protein